MKGRKPKPTKLRIIEGNPGRRPLPAVEIPPEPMPPPPDFLDDVGREEWNRKTTMLFRLGVLHGLDSSTLAMWCATFSRAVRAERMLREIEKNGGDLAGLLVKHKHGFAMQPLIRVVNQAVTTLNALAAQFYFSPVSRVKLENSEGGVPRKGSKFDGLIGKENSKFEK